MRKIVPLFVSMAVAVLLAGGVALALPSEAPDATLMVNGPVRTFAQAGNNLWVGGNFTQVKRRDGTVVANVSNVAVFDLGTDRYVDVAPKLGAGSAGSRVTEIKPYGDDVLIGGIFAGPATNQRNLVAVDGATGVAGAQQPRGFRSSNPDTLDPNGDCQRRDGLAAYSFGGALDPGWDPALTGKYNLAWALHPEATAQGARLHVGGEFTKVNGITQSYYARFPPTSVS